MFLATKEPFRSSNEVPEKFAEITPENCLINWFVGKLSFSKFILENLVEKSNLGFSLAISIKPENRILQFRSFMKKSPLKKSGERFPNRVLSNFSE